MTKNYQQIEAGLELIKKNRGTRAKLSFKLCALDVIMPRRKRIHFSGFLWHIPQIRAKLFLWDMTYFGIFVFFNHT